jgi:hypothetical protein
MIMYVYIYNIGLLKRIQERFLDTSKALYVKRMFLLFVNKFQINMPSVISVSVYLCSNCFYSRWIYISIQRKSGFLNHIVFKYIVSV